MLRTRRYAVVISVKTLSGTDPAAYYLQREVGCEAGYYLDPAEPTGRWVGDGATALRLTGRLDEAGEMAFRRMLAGQHVEAGIGHRSAEPRRVVAEAVAQLAAVLEQVEHLQRRGYDRRRDAVREQVRT